MCGRYTSTTPLADVADYFAVDEVVADDRGPRWNVAPTDEVLAVAATESGRRLGSLRWGLVPAWAPNLSTGSRMINARAESLLEKPAFRPSFARRRCIVPADGFYEWCDGQAWHLHRADGAPLAFAGLWASWRRDDRRVRSCTIVTTGANQVVAPVHYRMPVVLDASDWAEWLDPDDDDVAALSRLLVPADDDLLVRRPVGPAVGNVANDGPDLVAPLVGPTPPIRLGAEA